MSGSRPQPAIYSSSDDDDEDPDNVEVPGGGKTLYGALISRSAAGQVALRQSPNKSTSTVSKLPEHDNSTPVKEGDEGTPATLEEGRRPIFHHYGLQSDPNAHFWPQYDPSWAGRDQPFTAPTFGAPYPQPNSTFADQNANAASTNGGVNPFTDPKMIEAMCRELLSSDTGLSLYGHIFTPKPAQKPAPINLGQIWGTSTKVETNPNPEADFEDSQEDEDMGVADVYADYKPSKLYIGEKHPDPVVETASLASVLPPDVKYTLRLPHKVIISGALSALQLEAVVYACQQHEYTLPSGVKAGYLIGDGAGVGKGRTIAGIILENWVLKRKRSLWISVSADLKYDSERDLKDIGAKIPVYSLSKHKYGKLTFGDGVIFSTYSSLIGESSQGGRFSTRLKQIITWFGKNNDGVIIFDECHRAKNLCPVGSAKPTKTGQKVHELQQELSNARVVYASATGASEPKNMAYMTRLGIWGKGTPFKAFTDFISAVEKRGVGAMEILAMDMKLRGAYIARQLSFQGVAFTIEEVGLTPEFVDMYDNSVALWVEALQKFIEAIELMCVESRIRKGIWAQFWSSHQRFFKYLCIAAKVKRACEIARDAVKNGKCVVIGLQSTGEARTLDQLEKDDGELNDFVSTAKGVFQTLVEKHFPAPNRRKINQLLGIKDTSSMFKELMQEAAASTSSAVAGGSSSNKRKTVRKAAQKASKRQKLADSDDSGAASDSDSDFQISESSRDVDTESGSASHLESDATPIESDDSSSKRKKKGSVAKSNKVQPSALPSKANSDIASSMKSALLEKIEKIGERLPPNTLDQLIDDLGGPSEVAEMTGRKGRVVQNDQGHVVYETRSEVDVSLELINMTEKERFMAGDKLIAIISEAASSGISLQSDRRAKNQRRRVHITLELPWSADRAIQQFGRTHRSNQVNAPEYMFLISDLAGEHRFASIVAKRLESLGALTHGDRRATESRDLSRFHIDNRYGRQALETIMRNIMNGDQSSIPIDYFGDFNADIAGALVGVGLIVNSEEQRGMPILDKECTNMSKFLNRILGMPVRLQNALFDYFTSTLSQIVSQAKRTGRFDLGILDVSDSGTGKILEKPEQVFKSKHATGEGEIKLHELQVERGLSWTQAQAKELELNGKNEGFYLSKQARNGKKVAILAIADSTNSDMKDKRTALYSIYRPNTGLQVKRELLHELQSKYKKVDADECASMWVDQYDDSETRCNHAFWSGRCKSVAAGNKCEVGLRSRTYFVLSGTILLVWQKVENIFAMFSHGNSIMKMQIVRVRSQDLRIVGMLVPTQCVNYLVQSLKEKEEGEEESQESQSDDETNLIELS